MILKSYAFDVVDDVDVIFLEVNREDVWRACLSFYKVVLKHPERFKKNPC